jgi:hypothetical protein
MAGASAPATLTFGAGWLEPFERAAYRRRMRRGHHGGFRAGLLGLAAAAPSAAGFAAGGLPAATLSAGMSSAAVLAAGALGCEAGNTSFSEPPLGAARQALGDAGGAAEPGDASVPDGLTPGAAPSASNDCCSTSSSGGCSDVSIQACVCEGDAFCCSTEYDGACVTQAQARCGLDCDERAPESNCCAPSGVPGCTSPEVQSCICDIDPFCCVFRFDLNCVNLGAARCGAVCGDAGVTP